MVIVEDLTKWQELVNERDALQWKLDHANVRFYLFFFCLFVCFVLFFAFSLFYYYKESLIFFNFYFSLKIIT